MSRIIFALLFTLLVSEPATCDSCVEPKRAAREYLALNFHFQRINERNLALSDAGLQEPQWSELETFFAGGQFYYFVTSIPSQTYALLEVKPDCSVVLLDDLESLNEVVISAIKPGVATNHNKELFAQLLLKMLHVSEVFGRGYEDGVNVIEGIEDIQFDDEKEWIELDECCHIEPPSIVTDDDGFAYLFYSWERKGNGNVFRNSLTYRNESGIVFERELVKPSVGQWKPVR